jgi:hypothetical protein
MKHFILKDKTIDILSKHKDKLRKYYEQNKNNLYFNNLEYKDKYYLSLIHSKERKDNWEELKKLTPEFIDIFEESMVIIPAINIGRIPSYPNGDWFLSHSHLFKTDGTVYNYILKCNDRSGMIIGEEYLPYREDLIFGFNSRKNHISFNFGDTIKDSYIIITLNKKYTLKDWFDEKISFIINNKYNVYEMNKKTARKKIKRITGY